LAGKTAAEAIHANNTSKAALSVYDSGWRNSGFGWNLRLSHAGHGFYNKLSDEQLDRIFAEFPDCQIDNISLITLLKAFVKNNPKLLLHLPGLAKVLFSK
ncbi:MAG TPA: NAD(P)/FAD-dependent oxidoreductase, partial [Methanocorpusculum sp.]|nr:NAD(P)/FAD-dependent oxidoreductase [Methanocorpusculum sp.]